MTQSRCDLRDDLRLQPGPVPTAIAGAILERDGFAASRDAFLLTVTQDLRFHYRRGHGVRYSAGPELDPAAVSLFYNGSVHGAAAWMNGYVPLHASAVISQGRVHAFAGASSEGKSTLVAALGHRGLELFADDLLTVDTSDKTVLALPGHKRLKLWADALALTEVTGKERVWPGVDKYFVGDAAEPNCAALPLSSLMLLETSATDECSITQVEGAARLLAFNNSCYRPEYRLPCSAAKIFAQLASIAQSVPVFRFSRPRDPGRFAEGVDRVTAHVKSRQ